MGQAKIKRLKQQREAAERAANVPSQRIEPNKSQETFTPKFIENVKINYDVVIRFGKRQDRRFVLFYWDMQDRFEDRDYGRQVCLHQVIHAEGMEQDGVE